MEKKKWEEFFHPPQWKTIDIYYANFFTLLQSFMKENINVEDRCSVMR